MTVDPAHALVRPLNAVAWELRACWATGRRVSITIDSDQRLEGAVTAIAATSSFAMIAGTHVPLDRVLAVHRPSRLGDSSIGEGERWRGRARRLRRDPRQLTMDETTA